MKKVLMLVLSIFIGMSGVAAAAGSGEQIADLEKKITRLTEALETMQAEVEVLKQNESADKGASAAVSPDAEKDWSDKVALSGQVRFRGYDLKNMWSYDDSNKGDSWNTFRTRGSLKATVNATDDVTAVLQITNQTWGNGVTDAGGQEKDNLSNKFFLDNAYVHIRNVFNMPVDLKVGRQNLQYGSGFVLFDGNSQLGSTSAYFDGVKLTLHPGTGFNLDAIYAQDEENNRDNASDDDVSLSGLYATITRVPVIGKTEIYLLNRHDENNEKDIWMVGGRVSDKLEMGFDYSLEAAYQAGDALENVDQKAFGGKFKAGYTFTNAGMKPRFFSEYVYLSGDDPDTPENEGWDVFYGGWGGQYGDLLAWAFVNLPGSANVVSTAYDYGRLSSNYGEATFGNIKMATLGMSASLMKSLTSSVSYSNLTFDETYAGVDDDFGDYYQITLKYLYNKNLSFTVYGAMLSPGEAFSDTAGDTAREFYWETNYTF